MNRPYTARDHLPGELYRADQVRELDRLATEQENISGFELMSRAGEAAFACLLERWPDEQQICVFAGPGNNGGDAWVLAALARYHGMDVCFYTLGDLQQQSDSARQAREMALESGVKPQLFSGELDYEGRVIVDGLLGTGLNAAVRGDYDLAITAINQHWADVLALDLPSGLNADTGRIMGNAVEATLTVTFIGMKRGMLTAAGPDVCGAIAFASLAVDPLLYRQLPADAERISWDRLDRLGQRLPSRLGNAHKREFGHVLVVGGDQGMGGGGGHGRRSCRALWRRTGQCGNTNRACGSITDAPSGSYGARRGVRP
ncbi:MAG: NAD(P)H-hydrate epimerase [Saccharospirillaceae bacterium]|nr:NAD(P)H-hydrate epimerase [Saccharospirillaceae bacterium]